MHFAAEYLRRAVRGGPRMREQVLNGRCRTGAHLRRDPPDPLYSLRRTSSKEIPAGFDNARPLQLTGGGGRAIGCKWDPWVVFAPLASLCGRACRGEHRPEDGSVRAASHDARVTQVALQDNFADRVKDKLDVVRVGRARVVRVDLGKTP